MLKGQIPKISVCVITYNQEKVIARAIESILSQREYVFEICVSDDCSTDNTWDILTAFSEKYPNLFNLNRNENNLGIFENLEKVWTMPKGDSVHIIAGDDMVPFGWLKSVSDFVSVNGLDFENDKFLICGNFQCVYPNGDRLTSKKNRHVLLNVSTIRLYERGLVNCRSCVFSSKILRDFDKVSLGKSFIAENAQDCQIFINTNMCYYIDQVGNIYYSGIGVSSNMTEERRTQHMQTMNYAFEYFRRKNINIHKRDENLPMYNISYKEMRWNPSLANLIKLIKWWFLTFDPRLSFYSLDIKAKAFALIRRLPHTRPINW